MSYSFVIGLYGVVSRISKLLPHSFTSCSKFLNASFIPAWQFSSLFCRSFKIDDCVGEDSRSEKKSGWEIFEECECEEWVLWGNFYDHLKDRYF